MVVAYHPFDRLALIRGAVGLAMNEATKDLLGNGKLTVTARLAAVYGAVLATMAAGVLFYFGARTMERLDRMELMLFNLQSTVAVSDAEAATQKRRVDRMEHKVFP